MPDASAPDTSIPDASVPDATLEMSDFFRTCEEDWQCPGPNGVCRSRTDGWPGGFCTRSCPGGDRGPCDFRGTFNSCMEIEQEGVYECEQNCLSSEECRSGYLCADFAAVDRVFGRDPAGRCVPACETDADCGEAASCNVWTGRCYDSSEPDPSGETNGGACLGGPTDCRSNRCLGPTQRAAGLGTIPTGWTDGYCYSQCSLPAGYSSDEFWTMGDLPQAGCPAGNVCFPAASKLYEGELGYCMDECDIDSDCRAEDGYYCRKAFSGGVAPNGVCWFIGDCNTRGCPTGMTCREIPASRPFFRCERE